MGIKEPSISHEFPIYESSESRMSVETERNPLSYRGEDRSGLGSLTRES